MVQDIEYVPLVSFKNAVRGFVAGSFMAIAVASTWGIFAQILLFVIGVLIMMDSFLPHGTQPYILTSVITTIIGIAIGLTAAYFGLSIWYLVFVVIVTFMLYLDKVQSRVRRGPALTKSDRV